MFDHATREIRSLSRTALGTGTFQHDWRLQRVLFFSSCYPLGISPLELLLLFSFGFNLTPLVMPQSDSD